MIISMTSYSRLEETRQGLSVVIEIRTYNSRYLDISLRLPHGYLSLEDKIKRLIGSRLTRGRVEISLQIKNEIVETQRFEIDKAKATAYYQVLTQLQDMFNLEGQAPLDLMVRESGAVKPVEVDMDMAFCWEIIQGCAGDALDALEGMRKAEGDVIAQDFKQRLDNIEKCLDQIEADSGGLVSQYRSRLQERMGALTGGLMEIDPQRLLQEAALFADRSDISEEILRVRSHISQFRSLMASAEPAGRKLNFLLQEFNREFNTVGSKAGHAGISHTVVDVKSELEKMREQVQNVE
ncbi:MAG: YicC/YloC family endoribonuclease [Desulfobacterales bacterium]|nr:YicC/YloC family endoribonuclease [Desulfobacterales bacterium]